MGQEGHDGWAPGQDEEGRVMGGTLDAGQSGGGGCVGEEDATITGSKACEGIGRASVEVSGCEG